MSRDRSAFTLVEMLVVIGITVVLVGLLMPTLGKARSYANQLVCSSNMRQIGMAMASHALDHQGYMPYAGPLIYTGSPYAGAIPAPWNVKDLQQVKYDYYNHAPSLVGTMVMPIEAALGPYFGQTIRNDAIQNMTQDLGVNVDSGGSLHGGYSNWPTVRKIFYCPAESEPPLVSPYGVTWTATTPSGVDYTEYSSYLYNLNVFSLPPIISGLKVSEVTFGYNRPGGRIAAIGGSSEVALMTEFVASAVPVGQQQLFSSSPNLTLYDAMTGATGGFSYQYAAGYAQVFNQINNRHGTTMNVLFADGHVQAIGIPQMVYDAAGNVIPGSMINAKNSADMRRVYLWKD